MSFNWLLYRDMISPEDQLKIELGKIAAKYNISLEHLYVIVDRWVYAMIKAATNGLYPRILIDNYFVLYPRLRYFERRLRKLWFIYKRGSIKQKLNPKDPEIIEVIQRLVKTMKRIKFERK